MMISEQEFGSASDEPGDFTGFHLDLQLPDVLRDPPSAADLMRSCVVSRLSEYAELDRRLDVEQVNAFGLQEFEQA